MLRTPVVTARGLADSLAVTPQAALGLLRQLIVAGVVREATGRAAWRGLSPTAAARQLGLGRSTVYREVNRAGIEPLPQPA